VLLANQPDGVLHQTSEQNYRLREKWRARKAGKLATAAGPVVVGGRVLDPAMDGANIDAILADLTEVGKNGTSTGDRSAGPAVPRRNLLAESEGTPALAISGLVAGYSEAEVLHGVDLVVPEGSIVAVLGPNGTGKSTLCGAVAGTVQTTAGSISLFGRDITSMAAYERADAGIMIAPESRGIFPALTVEENLAVTLRSAADRTLALERFPQLAARRKLPASNLSGGEQQMLCLAPILVRPPRLLIADEISLGLAPTIVREVLGILRELRAAGLSILMVEEKAVHVIDLADYGAFLSFGVVSRAGPMSELTDEVAAEAYLGSGSHA
jgi:ABC-type branched-subunit amino acid transport system ATPase component